MGSRSGFVYAITSHSACQTADGICETEMIEYAVLLILSSLSSSYSCQWWDYFLETLASSTWMSLPFLLHPRPSRPAFLPHLVYFFVWVIVSGITTAQSTSLSPWTTTLRPPALPLAVRSPYLNAWLIQGNATGPIVTSWPSLWTAQSVRIFSMVLLMYIRGRCCDWACVSHQSSDSHPFNDVFWLTWLQWITGFWMVRLCAGRQCQLSGFWWRDS